MIKVHEVEKAIKKICQDSFDFETFNKQRAEVEILKFLEKIKKDFDHVEYDVQDNFVKLLLYTTSDDGFDLSFKITKRKQ